MISNRCLCVTKGCRVKVKKQQGKISENFMLHIFHIPIFSLKNTYFCRTYSIWHNLNATFVVVFTYIYCTCFSCRGRQRHKLFTCYDSDTHRLPHQCFHKCSLVKDTPDLAFLCDVWVRLGQRRSPCPVHTRLFRQSCFTLPIYMYDPPQHPFLYLCRYILLHSSTLLWHCSAICPSESRDQSHIHFKAFVSTSLIFILHRIY